VTPADGNRTARPVGILIVCPHRLAREGLRLVAEQDEGLKVVASAASADEAEELMPLFSPDVIAVGQGWDSERCASAVRRLKAACPAIPLLVLSADVEPEQVQAFIAAGATAFLPLDVGLDDLAHAIRTATRGELTLHPSVVPGFLRHLASEPTAPTDAKLPTRSFDDLSPRERDVIDLLTHGLGDRDIAQQLFISVRTVQSHLARIYEKMGVHTRTEAALIAVREGWVS
jgi:DNA-binding NarL/FixJ family response regulator